MNCWSSADSRPPWLRKILFSDRRTEKCRGEVCKGSAHEFRQSCFRSSESRNHNRIVGDFLDARNRRTMHSYRVSFGVRTARSMEYAFRFFELARRGQRHMCINCAFFETSWEKWWQLVVFSKKGGQSTHEFCKTNFWWKKMWKCDEQESRRGRNFAVYILFSLASSHVRMQNLQLLEPWNVDILRDQSY